MVVRKQRKRFLIIFLCSLGALAIYLYLLKRFLTVEMILQYESTLRLYQESHPFLLVLFFFLLFVTAVISMLPATIPLTVLSGMLFGTVKGALLAVCASIVGATLGILVIRFFFRKFLLQRHKAEITVFQDQIQHHGFWYLIAMQLFPVTPYALIIVFVGVSQIILSRFWIASVVGLTPAYFAYSYLGNKLLTVARSSVTLSPVLFWVLMGASLIALVPIVVKIFNKRTT